MVSQRIWPGNSVPNVTTIPDKWDSQWFRRFITNHLLPADPRNMAVAGGLTLTQSQSARQPPTLSTTAGAFAPGNEPFLLAVNPPDSLLTARRVFAVDTNVFAITDGGAGSTLTLGKVSGGFPNNVLAAMPTLTIKGNNTGGASTPLDLTAAQVNAILPTFTSSLNGLAPASFLLAATKSADTTKSNQTLANDADLSITITQTGTYTFEIFLAFYEAVGGTGGFQFDLNGGGATIGAILFGTSGFSNATVALAGATAANAAQAFATIQTSASSPSWCVASGQVSFSATGTFTLRWAQNTTSVNVTTLKANSFMQLVKVG
jgi:hypothetical protein